MLGQEITDKKPFDELLAIKLRSAILSNSLVLESTVSIFLNSVLRLSKDKLRALGQQSTSL